MLFRYFALRVSTIPNEMLVFILAECKSQETVIRIELDTKSSANDFENKHQLKFGLDQNKNDRECYVNARPHTKMKYDAMAFQGGLRSTVD